MQRPKHGIATAALAVLPALLAAPGLAGVTPVPEADAAYGEGAFREAARLWREACDAGNASGCYELAIVYRDGEGVKPDHGKAHELLEQACDGGDGRGCFNLAQQLFPDEEFGIEPADISDADLSLAIGYFTRGCDAGMFEACANLASYYRDGRGVEQDVARAVGLLEGACAVDERKAGRACFTLAMIYDAHEAETALEDPALSNNYLARGCSMADNDSCINLGYHYRTGYGVERDFVKARSLYTIACNDGDGLACPMYAPNEYFGASTAYSGTNVKQRLLTAAGLYEDACDGGLAQGCAALAYAVIRSGQAEASEAQLRALLGHTLDLQPGHWLAGWLLSEIDAGNLPVWDQRNRYKP